MRKLLAVLIAGLAIALPLTGMAGPDASQQALIQKAQDAKKKLAAAQAATGAERQKMMQEHMKMMQDMMAKQGMSMGSGAGGGMSARVCITKDMAARNEAPAQRGDCKQEHMQRSGNTTKFKFTCANPPSSGEGEVTVHNAESYTMKMKMSRDVKGKPEQMTMDAQGKFLGNDCGSVKPVKG